MEPNHNYYKPTVMYLKIHEQALFDDFILYFFHLFLSLLQLLMFPYNYFLYLT